MVNEYRALLVIVQPRDKMGDKHKVFDMSFNDLYKVWFHDTLRPAYLDAISTEPTVHPGEKQCRWCDIAYKCVALADMS